MNLTNEDLAKLQALLDQLKIRFDGMAQQFLGLGLLVSDLRNTFAQIAYRLETR